jgi:hypothetical protein
MRMRAVVVLLIAGLACNSNAPPKEHAAIAPPAPIVLAPAPESTGEVRILAARSDKRIDPEATYSVDEHRDAYDTLVAMSTLTGRYALVISGARMPWVFGVDDKTVTTRERLRVTPNGLELGEVVVPWSRWRDVLEQSVHALSQVGSVPIGITLYVERDVASPYLARVLELLSISGVHSVEILADPRVDVATVPGQPRGYDVPSLVVGQPLVTTMERAIVRRYIKRNIQKLQYCYEKQLFTRPGVAGSMTIDFTIQPPGNVTDTRVTSPTPEITACATDVVNAIMFPKPPEGKPANVQFPFTLRLGGG